MIETNGWDTHSGQRGRLQRAAARPRPDRFGAEDRLRAAIGRTRWSSSRPSSGGPRAPTAQADRSRAGVGRDAARRRGRGGKVVADWPGLSSAALYEGRDLKPTTDLDALIAGALAQHYALAGRAMGALFPESRGRLFTQPLIA